MALFMSAERVFWSLDAKQSHELNRLLLCASLWENGLLAYVTKYRSTNITAIHIVIDVLIRSA